ncbi:MAG: hypothetical protein PHH27_02860 [Candidatus Colwellbacteria bacterium]|jgi:hypothetical protein|nr:hypothetical protein [Candidatus Colwellbacteria bacterium]MCK9497771.1 hypothetical protein [Candidatus Colwellbacteria bacterium]MDD4819093.1 hypothetical protein [Candidatus Colwellbacteria bacterium]
MEKTQFDSYLDKIRERSKKSRIHSKHQMIGLMVAETLDDPKHKALYIKMARDNNGEKMLYIAKSIADNPKVKNKGAYFMRLWQLENKETKNNKNGTKPSNNKKRKSKNIKAKNA